MKYAQVESTDLVSVPRENMLSLLKILTLFYPPTEPEAQNKLFRIFLIVLSFYPDVGVIVAAPDLQNKLLLTSLTF